MRAEDQVIFVRFAFTVAHHHPELYDELMNMSMKEIADKINELEGCNLAIGTPLEEVRQITEDIQRNHKQHDLLP